MTAPPHRDAEGSDTTRLRVAVIGAGRTGLALSHALLKAGLRADVDFAVLDPRDDPLRQKPTRRSQTPDGPARRLALPGSPLAGDPHRRVRADEMAEYLDRYALRLGVHPRRNTRVHGVSPESDSRTLSLATTAGTIRAGSVVAATEPYTTPSTPPFAARARVPGIDIHSDGYTDAAAVPPGTVLVVGAGPGGREIAHELAHSHNVLLSTSLRPRRRLQHVAGDELPLDLLRAHGVVIVERIADATGAGFLTADGTTLTPTSVIWATGYRQGFDYLPEQAASPTGGVLHRRGVTPVPGLFVLGLHGQAAAAPRRIARDASRIARLIGRRT